MFAYKLLLEFTDTNGLILFQTQITVLLKNHLK